MTNYFSPAKINLRATLRLALLAAAETCWLYALLLTIGALTGLPRAFSAFGIFFVYAVGLAVGRFLPRSTHSWRILQFLTVMFAALAILVALRIGLYTDVPLWDFTWAPRFVSRLSFLFENVTAELISVIVLIVAFVRALGFAQRPLTLWLIGFQFRLGIVLFFGITLLGWFGTPVNFIPYVFLYFIFSLLGIALARIEEAGQERPLGWRWALVLCSILIGTMLVGYIATQLLTLDRVNTFFAFFTPLRDALVFVVAIIAIPFIYLLELLLRLIAPLFDRIIQLVAGWFPNLNFDNSQTRDLVTQAGSQLENIWPYVRVIAIVLVVAAVGWWIAHALNKRMKWYEQEHFERETLDADDELTFEKRRRARAAHARQRSVSAENVRRIYVALLVHAQTLGLPRHEAETPLEFLPRLTARFPQASDALRTLTSAYVAVHYAEQEFTPARVRELRALWQHTKEKMSDETKKMNR